MKYSDPIIEAAAVTDMRTGIVQPSEVLKRFLQKQRILSAAGKKVTPRTKGMTNKTYTVMSPQETLKRYMQKKRILDMLND